MQSSADYLSIILNETPLFDVRAPIEHSKGAINNAQNLPIMSDKERELVGTCYKNNGQDAAIALGRKLVTAELQQQRTQAWLAFSQQHPEGLLYCFRGGLRSKITQQWMKDSGVDYPFVEGGYKALRRFLIDELEVSVASVPIMLLSGRTGSGKTRVLKKLAHQVDLEGLANHRGSSFGADIHPQPSPIDFENSISSALLKHRHQHNKMVFLEDEGRLIGSLTLPLNLKSKMQNSEHIELDTEIEQRIDYAIEDYILDLLNGYLEHHDQQSAFDLLAQRHTISLTKIRKRLGAERFEQAIKLLENAISIHKKDDSTRGYRSFIHLLLTQYYDPMYDYQLEKKQRKAIFSGNSQAVIHYIDQLNNAAN